MATYTESFDLGTDNLDLADQTLDLTWSHVQGDNEWQTLSSGASPRGDLRGLTEYDRAEHDADSADTYSQVVVTTLPTSSFFQVGALIRLPSDSLDGYMAMVDGNDSSIYIKRLDAGSQTDLITAVVVDVTGLPKVLRTEAEGSTIRAFWDGTEVASTTDATHSTGTRGGLYGHESPDAQVEVDDFEFGDLSAGPSAPSGVLTVAEALNVAAGTDGLTEVGAANALAGTTGLTLAGALNSYASTSGLTEAGAANAAAGTDNLTLAGACNVLAEAA